MDTWSSTQAAVGKQPHRALVEDTWSQEAAIRAPRRKEEEDDMTPKSADYRATGISLFFFSRALYVL